MTRFTPARTYLTASAVALGLAVFSGWWALTWMPAAFAAGLFTASGGLVLYLALRPTISVREKGLLIGKRAIEWKEIRRVDQTGWVSPLVVHLTLADATQVRILYPGTLEACNHLSRLLQQHSTEALINGVPYRQIWGEPEPEVKPVVKPAPAPRYRLLTEDDEAEVERLYQRLKTAGHLDPEK
jgi:hypothetical protein